MLDSEEVFNETRDYIESSTQFTNIQKAQLNRMNSERGVQCMMKMWLNYNYEEVAQGAFCDAAWDNVYCWPPIPAGKVITMLCSEAFREIDAYHASHMKGNARRVCLANGRWADGKKSDFTECKQSYDDHIRELEDEKLLVPLVTNMLFVGSILSLLCLGTSLAIFYRFRCLWCDRVTVHVHLIFSLVLRFVVLLTMTEPFVFGRYPNYKDTDILCETVLVLFFYSTVSSIAWMFIQGLYLTISLTTRVFSGNARYHLRVYYFIGWVVPAILIVAYVIAMLAKGKQDRCWKGYGEMNEMWILLAPIIFVLAINAIFLINILRILLEKVRNSNSRSDNSQFKAAAKATAVLFPVLGINNIIVLYNPGGVYNRFFVILNTFFSSTQGIFVAIVYCFNNKEVKGAIRRSLDRVIARREANSNHVQGSTHPRQQASSLMMVEIPSHQRNDQTDCTSVEQAV